MPVRVFVWIVEEHRMYCCFMPFMPKGSTQVGPLPAFAKVVNIGVQKVSIRALLYLHVLVCARAHAHASLHIYNVLCCLFAYFEIVLMKCIVLVTTAKLYFRRKNFYSKLSSGIFNYLRSASDKFLFIFCIACTWEGFW